MTGWSGRFSLIFCTALDLTRSFLTLLVTAYLALTFPFLSMALLLGTFKAGRGIRQGDPFSLTLFTIYSDLLSRILSKAEQEGKISGIKVSRENPKITHLMYADDFVIYYRATTEEATEVTKCLELYCEWTGQQINWSKLVINFSRNVPNLHKGEITRLMSMQECTHKSKYLGHPFYQLKSKFEVYKEVLERFANKLAGWKQKSLSMAGRLILAKTVAQAIPAFVMQVILLPKHMLAKWVRRFGTSFGATRKKSSTTFTSNLGTQFASQKMLED